MVANQKASTMDDVRHKELGRSLLRVYEALNDTGAKRSSWKQIVFWMAFEQYQQIQFDWTSCPTKLIKRTACCSE